MIFIYKKSKVIFLIHCFVVFVDFFRAPHSQQVFEGYWQRIGGYTLLPEKLSG
jgi:hypothetical protein